jgi:hypothetical protein
MFKMFFYDCIKCNTFLFSLTMYKNLLEDPIERKRIWTYVHQTKS